MILGYCSVKFLPSTVGSQILFYIPMIRSICLPDVTIGFLKDEFLVFESNETILVEVALSIGTLVGEVFVALTTSSGSGNFIPSINFLS